MNFSLSFKIAPAALLAATLASSPSAYVGKWHTYMDMSRVTSIIAHGNSVYAGTLGGVRRISAANPTDGSQRRDFQNLDGLIDPWITGLATGEGNVLWAIARSGYLYELERGGERWKAHGASYAAQQWVMNDRAVVSSGRYLFLGSQKGLAVFDTRQKVSQLTLTRFGSEPDVEVLSLLRRDDTLFAGTSAGVYKARLYFADPLNPPEGQGFNNPADPGDWSKVVFPPDTARRYEHLAIVDDTLATFGAGTLLQGDVVVKAFAGDSLVIGTHKYLWTDCVAALRLGNRLFVGGGSGLKLAASPTDPAPELVTIYSLRAFPRDTVANIGAYGDVVYGHAQSGLKRVELYSGQVVEEPSLVNVNPPGVQEELYYRFLRNVVVTPTADVYVGSWGGGLVRRRADGQNQAWKNSAAPNGSCLAPLVPGDPFTIVAALSRPYPKPGPGASLGGLFIANQTEDNTYQLAYFDTAAGIVQCPPSGLGMPGASPHAVHLFSDTLLGVATETGVTFMKIREEGAGPRFENARTWSLPGATTAEAWDLATDRWGRPWAIIGDRLAFLDSLETSTTYKLTPIDNFIGTDCKSLESDPAGNLWVGCSNGLFHVTTGAAGELGNVRRYGMSDGLPSLFIFDVTVDPANGRVWVATDRGLAMFESASQPPRQSGDLQDVLPYPNPFRPHHAFVVFDKIPVNSTLRIHGPGGEVVRIYRPGELKGNQAQWDGRNEKGQRVQPGVYMFSITSGSVVKRGKVIVAR